MTPDRGGCQPALRATADAGAAAVWQHGDSSVIAPTLAGELDLRDGRTLGRLTLTSTLAATDRWSAQGDLLLTRFAGSYAAPWELGASASTLRFNGGPAATQLATHARRHLDRLTWGAWAGAGTGVTARKYWHAPILSADAGTWSRHGPLQLSLGVTTQRAHLDSSNAYIFDYADATPPAPTSAATAPLQPAVVVRQGFDIKTLVATDITALATWRTTRVELTASGTARHAPAQSPHPLGSALASLAWWARPDLAVTTSAGALAADPFRNVPTSRFVTIGARWRPSVGTSLHTRPPQTGARDPRLPDPPPGHTAADVARRDSARLLRITAPGATTVDVRGDATEWRPTPLARHGHHWELPLPLPPGTHRLLVRIDGGPWTPPGNLPTVEDDFGTRVGLLVVP